VSLEPCSHHGRTPPCVEAILRAPVGRVVTPLADPDTRVAGRGIAVLRKNGVQVDVGCRAGEAAELNHVFIARQRRGRAFVALKVALSRDDCVATRDGTPTQITGPEAQRHAHRLRAGLDGILVGVETLRRDRPRLDRRFYEGPGLSPRRLVIDPDLRAEPEWLWPGEATPVVFCSRAALEQRGLRYAQVAELCPLPSGRSGLDLHALLGALPELGLWSLLVEGGGRTHREFLAAGLWDRLYLYRNPHVELAGLKWVASEAWAVQAGRLEPLRREALGADALAVYAHPDSLVPVS
jgi:diaminohydroxyphosphoribosylaminopyrimidine deaminase/5-amino-6-(5-phosphoribosylamino)uracil reductase